MASASRTQIALLVALSGAASLRAQTPPPAPLRLSFVDAVRHFVPPEERLYTWWSYRARDWAASDRGRRLDHVWVTPPLVGSLAAARVLRDSRGWAKASDHVPVMIELG